MNRQKLYVSTSLDSLIFDDANDPADALAEPHDHIDKETSKIYRLLTPAYYAWIHAGVSKLKTQKFANDPGNSAWLELLAKFKFINEYAINADPLAAGDSSLGRAALEAALADAAAIASYTPPRSRALPEFGDTEVESLIALLSSDQNSGGPCEIDVKPKTAPHFTLVVAYSVPPRDDRLEISIRDFRALVDIKREFPDATINLRNFSTTMATAMTAATATRARANVKQQQRRAQNDRDENNA